jgi:2-keto-4-pentenoate hydratase/2-oxohepta-3-ene-1,7-dioic acid hydratase in catechol pathway
MTEFSFATIRTPEGERAAVLVNSRYYRLDQLIPGSSATGLRPLLDDWDGLLERTTRSIEKDLSTAAAIEDAQLLAPVRYPNKLICVGAVYSDHLEQFNLPPQRWSRMPIFLRPPTTSIVGPGRTVRIPSTTRQFDWEIELAVVMGRRLRAGDNTEARAAIAGYTIGIDFTCRDLLDRGSPIGVDLIRAKAQDDMAPLGPVVVPAQFVGDPQCLSLRLWVNDELRQDGTTANMLFPVYEQIATISRFITLEPGDIVLTGSPAGSARSEEEFLKPGDRIRAQIDRVGTLELELMSAPVRPGPGAFKDA